MEAENKYFETGSNPYYLNLNNTAKEFTYNDNTNPQYGLLDVLSKFIIVEDTLDIVNPIITQEQVFLEI